MATKAPFWTRSHLFLQVHAGTGTPYAVRINSSKLIGLTLLVGVAWCACLMGSLLFFRELEVSRKLQERVLEFETSRKLEETLQSSSRSLAADAAPVLSTAAAPSVDKNATATAPITPAKAPVVSTANPSAPVPMGGNAVQPARVAEVAVACLEEQCSAKISLVPLSAGIAQGQILVILETEIPRIGARNLSTNVRKRYFLYPSNQSRDELTERDLDLVPHKPFRFTRALQTQVKFEIGKLLRPLALNVYLFDTAGNRTHHERKVIEREE